MMNTTSIFYKITLGLTIIGGINWGVIGLFECNLFTALLDNTLLPRIIYVLVGLSAVFVAIVQLQTINNRNEVNFND